MKFSVWVIKADGSSEVLAEDIDAERAESIKAHPSNYGKRVVVTPSFQGVPMK